MTHNKDYLNKYIKRDSSTSSLDMKYMAHDYNFTRKVSIGKVYLFGY